jgi:hypothetical protein
MLSSVHVHMAFTGTCLRDDVRSEALLMNSLAVVKEGNARECRSIGPANGRTKPQNEFKESSRIGMQCLASPT